MITLDQSRLSMRFMQNGLEIGDIVSNIASLGDIKIYANTPIAFIFNKSIFDFLFKRSPYFLEAINKSICLVSPIQNMDNTWFYPQDIENPIYEALGIVKRMSPDFDFIKRNWASEKIPFSKFEKEAMQIWFQEDINSTEFIKSFSIPEEEREKFRIGNLTQDDICKYSAINEIFLLQPKKVLEYVFQTKNIYHSEDFFEFYLDLRKIIVNLDCTYGQFGRIEVEDTIHSFYNFVGFYAFKANKTLKDSISYIYKSLDNNTCLKKNEKDYIQDKYIIFDDVCNSYQCPGIISENLFYNNIIAPYFNEEMHAIGYVRYFHNDNNELVRIYYFFYHKHNSSKLKLAPIYPQQPYPLYFLEKPNNEYDAYYFVSTEFEVLKESFNKVKCISCIDEKSNRSSKKINCLYLTCPLTLEYLPNTDLTKLSKDVPLYINWSGNVPEVYIKQLVSNVKHKNIYFVINNTALSIDYILSNDEYIIHDQSDINLNSKIIKPGESVCKKETMRKIILDPILESGSLMWLFSKEKIGKTWLALTIAYACSKGHKQIGQWNVNEPCKVLYIDGEMPGDRINEKCDKIMKGYGDSSGFVNRTFAIQSFYENHKYYDSILDEEWLNDNKQALFGYDLLILDNYYSLNNNTTNVAPFIQFLRELQKKNVAIIVVDHTNSEGELQGSINKKRAADFGILLEKCENGLIMVKNQFDRYGVEFKSPDHKLKFCFTNEEFKIINVINEDLQDKIDTGEQELNDQDKKILFSYILTIKDIMQGKEVANKMSLSSGRITQLKKAAQDLINDKDSKDVKISNKTLLIKEIHRLKNETTNSITDEFESFCQQLTKSTEENDI